MAINDKHYHPAIGAKLRPLLEARNWEGVTNYLGTLSNSMFRTAGYMLGENLSMALPEEDFWALAHALICFNSKAMLGTMLKAIATRLHEGTLSTSHPGFHALSSTLSTNEIDTQKTLLALLPEMTVPEQTEQLFLQLNVTTPQRKLPYLLRTATVPAAYALMQALRHIEGERPLLIRTVVVLMKRGDALSFNLASLLRAYFGLDEVRGTFSLRLEPFQLARLAENYEAFSQAMKF